MCIQILECVFRYLKVYSDSKMCIQILEYVFRQILECVQNLECVFRVTMLAFLLNFNLIVCNYLLINCIKNNRP